MSCLMGRFFHQLSGCTFIFVKKTHKKAVNLMFGLILPVALIPAWFLEGQSNGGVPVVGVPIGKVPVHIVPIGVWISLVCLLVVCLSVVCLSVECLMTAVSPCHGLCPPMWEEADARQLPSSGEQRK